MIVCGKYEPQNISHSITEGIGRHDKYTVLVHVRVKYVVYMRIRIACPDFSGLCTDTL